jgi:hypothetical protein
MVADYMRFVEPDSMNFVDQDSESDPDPVAIKKYTGR